MLPARRETGKRCHRIAMALAIVTLAFTPLTHLPLPAQESDEPRKSGLIERTGARLVQIDATLTGPEEVLDEPWFL